MIVELRERVVVAESEHRCGVLGASFPTAYVSTRRSTGAQISHHPNDERMSPMP